MRYKQLITDKLDQVQNLLNGLNSLLSQAKTRHEFDAWLEKVKDKVEEVQTLINSEN